MPGSDAESIASQEKPANGLTASPEALSTIGSVHEHLNGAQEGDGGYAARGPGGSDAESEGIEEEEDGDDGSGEGESGEDREDEDEEDEEDEDEDEPALKYERFEGVLHDLLKKDSASAVSYANKRLTLGTHAGIVHVLDMSGQRIKSVKPHSASIIDICTDETSDFIATASMDGQVVIHSMSTPEAYSFDMKRPMRTVALEPNFAKRSSRAFICGGMAGNLVLHEKGWLGHKETLLHSGEGPIWQVRWRGRLIAWANDMGVKIYDTTSQMRIIFIDRHADSPRADLFKCNLHWQDDSTLLIAWADEIKVARIRARQRGAGNNAPNVPPLMVEITAVFQLDCMLAGIVPHSMSSPVLAPPTNGTSNHTRPASISSLPPPALTSFLVLAYTPPDPSLLRGNEVATTHAEQARKAAERPELRIISRAGEELAADALTFTGYERFGCNDYILVDIPSDDGETYYIVLSPKDIVVVRPRDWRDHVTWLVERKRYEEALDELERRQSMGEQMGGEEDALSATQIGQRYIEHLVSEGKYQEAAHLCPKVCGQDTKRWEDWIFVFTQQHRLQAIIPYVPTDSPTLGHLVYEMILAYFLSNDRQALLKTIQDWPKGIYDISAVIVAVQSELDRAPSSSSSVSAAPDTVILMECLAELYMANRQYGKALPFFIRLRRPNVFDLIRDHNLFTAVQDQALLLVEFDHELSEKRRKDGDESVDFERGAAITLLVDHIHSIPIGRVVQQLQGRPYYLYVYLDALSAHDQHLTSRVGLYAEYAPHRLIDFLRVSNYYNLERAFRECEKRDLVPEMVFLLGRMGDNKRALNLIIERLGDVHRAIEFAKEQHDDDLWEDLLKYSESRPTFIRGLLENVGAEIDPIRLIRRIKNGLEIPGLKAALIKILHDFNLQMSLLEGCQMILNGDAADLARHLHTDQTAGFFLNGKTICSICSLPLIQTPQPLLLLYLCRHVVHAHCANGDAPSVPYHESDDVDLDLDNTGHTNMNARVARTALIRAKISSGCPACLKKAEGGRS
ncbi:Vacuolar protein sorting-associated protein 41 [Steccherinum ochraceum]|uniref:Vacuolar protein sorting-associated protein 41 n=1 Tax=Steccherinum ochraceum TaxID=92696 RepID=A0A4R0RE85_9APHY|nr:Vacuolar protein sorting-associated protein 41 [Steccherinum ochraceum]